MGWDSNPRKAFTFAGFQDRFLKPLGHPSSKAALIRTGFRAVYALQRPALSSDDIASCRLPMHPDCDSGRERLSR